MEKNSVFKNKFKGFFTGFAAIFVMYTVFFNTADNALMIAKLQLSIYTCISVLNALKIQYQHKEVSLADISIVKDATDVAGLFIKYLPFKKLFETLSLGAVFLLILNIVSNMHTSFVLKELDSLYASGVAKAAACGMVIIYFLSLVKYFPVKLSAVSRLLYTSWDFIHTSFLPQKEKKLKFLYNKIEHSPLSRMDKTDILLKNYPFETAENLDIIVIQSETFFDIKKYEDKLEKNGIKINSDINYAFNRYQSKGIGGKFFVSAVGGGTANTEFEFLTGLSAKYFFNGGVVFSNMIKKRTDSIAHFLSEEKGFNTIAVHNYIPEFWKRNHNYPLLGFDRFYSIEDFCQKARQNTIGKWMRDETLFDKVTEKLEENNSKNNFVYAVTVQNHAPFVNGADEKIEMHGLSENDRTEIENYASLLKASNHALENFMNYIDSRQKPALVIYFGDHKMCPYYDIFQNSKYFCEKYKKNMYSTDYFMYFNPAAQMSKIADISGIEKDITAPALGQLLRIISGDRSKKTMFLYNLSKNIDTYLDPYPDDNTYGDLYRYISKTFINTYDYYVKLDYQKNYV